MRPTKAELIITLAGLVQPGWAAVLICALALWALARWHIDAAWVVLCAALAGWLFF
ncbi:hypothetical protein [Duganella sp. HH105]|uniref:hypothetical protein n=1 Tax=Duganella sp. HH105 TaxID=1781067 RepID=UPI00143C978C|nr:hypothetical protein [Duganella sp. HH105]